MVYSELVQHFNNIDTGVDDFASIYVLSGKDDYLIEKVKATFSNYIDKDYADFNLSIFEQDQYSEAIDSLYTFPMFTDKRLVILNLNQDKDLDAISEAVDQYLKDPSGTAIFVVDASLVKDFKVKSKDAFKVKCEFETDDEMYREMQDIAHRNPSIEIEPQACIELAQRTQRNMHRVVGEIMKLKSYANGVITKQDIIDMVSADLDFRTYELTEAVNNKDADKALKVLTILLRDGATSVMILKNLYDKYRMMLHIELNKNKTNDELGEIFGVKGGQIYYARKISSTYSQVKLKNCVDYLHRIQFDIVYGKRQEVSALHEAILQLLVL